jgi:hypothetical protein
MITTIRTASNRFETLALFLQQHHLQVMPDQAGECL